MSSSNDLDDDVMDALEGVRSIEGDPRAAKRVFEASESNVDARLGTLLFS